MGTLSRRELLAAGFAAGASLTIGAPPARGATHQRRIEFAALADGSGWPGWTCPGVANLRRAGGAGLLEAASDVFPYDPRPVAFPVDFRFVNGQIEATVLRAGAGAGVVIRRVGPRNYYAAVYDAEAEALLILRRSPQGVSELARALVGSVSAPLRLTLAAAGEHPTVLKARLESSDGSAVEAAADDGARQLQHAGDPGVLATARTLFPSQGPEL